VLAGVCPAVCVKYPASTDTTILRLAIDNSDTQKPSMRSRVKFAVILFFIAILSGGRVIDNIYHEAVR